MEHKALFDVVDVRGADASTFLHSQFAADLKSLADGMLRWTALLNPQGRVLFVVGALRENSESWRLFTPFARGAELADWLRRFVFRSKVRIEADAGTVAESDGGIDVGVAGLRLSISDRSDPRVLHDDAIDRFVRAGLALIDPAASGRHLAHSLRLERFDGFSVNKGCYPGQEIVARTHFLGRNKRVLARLEASGPVAWRSGDLLYDGDTEIGEIASAGRQQALAVLTQPVVPGQNLGPTAHPAAITVAEVIAAAT